MHMYYFSTLTFFVLVYAACEPMHCGMTVAAISRSHRYRQLFGWLHHVTFDASSSSLQLYDNEHVDTISK